MQVGGGRGCSKKKAGLMNQPSMQGGGSVRKFKGCGCLIYLAAMAWMAHYICI